MSAGFENRRLSDLVFNDSRPIKAEDEPPLFSRRAVIGFGALFGTLAAAGFGVAFQITSGSSRQSDMESSYDALFLSLGGLFTPAFKNVMRESTAAENDLRKVRADIILFKPALGKFIAVCDAFITECNKPDLINEFFGLKASAKFELAGVYREFIEPKQAMREDLEAVFKLSVLPERYTFDNAMLALRDGRIAERAIENFLRLADRALKIKVI